MSTFKEKACLQVTAPAFLRDNKSKTIELLKLRQCRDTCCARIFTDKRAEELVDRGFATTSEDKASTSKEGSLGTFPIRTEIKHEGSGEFTVILDTAVGPIVPTFNPAKNRKNLWMGRLPVVHLSVCLPQQGMSYHIETDQSDSSP